MPFRIGIKLLRGPLPPPKLMGYTQFFSFEERAALLVRVSVGDDSALLILLVAAPSA